MRRSVFVWLLLPVFSACAQPFSFGLMGGASLTQDFQNYDLPPCCAPFQGGPDSYRILGASTPQRWIAGGTLEVRLPLHLSVEVDGLYHELQFKTGSRSAKLRPTGGALFISMS